MGPSNSPEKATATESPGIEGTNQMRSSRIRACERLGVCFKTKGLTGRESYTECH